MTETRGCSPEKKSGCGLLGAMFGRRGFWLRRTTSTDSLPIVDKDNVTKVSRDASSSKRRRGGGGGGGDSSSSEATVSNRSNEPDGPPRSADRIIARPGPNHVKQQPLLYQQGRRPIANETAMVTSSGPGVARKVPREAIGISGELESMIADHQRAKGGGGGLVRASSNVTMFGNMGNLRQPGNSDYSDVPGGKYTSTVMGNLGTTPTTVQPIEAVPAPAPASLCRAISTRMDPETLKVMGNEDFKNGRFEEALALYDAAINIDPNKASYRSNKSAALTALGRILEAVFECREAIQIEPHYCRAHQRLGTLYLRLGEAEKALYHYKRAGPEVDPDAIEKAKKVQAILNKCTDAKKQRDWNTLIRETANVMSTGADSAPQIYALQAEAFLRLRRHQDADEVLRKGPKFEVEECTKFFGPFGNANLLVVRAQVDMASGRFEDALAAAQRAAQLDSNSREVGAVTRRARAVAAARSNGNALFKAGKFLEACNAYGEGLDHDPYNSVLMCNRAACRSKLGQVEKAIEDCSTALIMRPSYAKARLRRADCFAKMKRWEASMRDYEILVRECPEDEEVGRGLLEARAQLKKQQGGDEKELEGKLEAANDVTVISSIGHFTDLVTSSGMCVVYFCKEEGDEPTLQFMGQLGKRYPSISFLKVESEDLPNLVKSEDVSSTPSFKIYKNGSGVEEVAEDSHDLLESSIKRYATT